MTIFNHKKIAALGVSAAMLLGTSAMVQDVIAQDAVEEVVVTGSYIKQTPSDATIPVDVTNQEDLFNLGSPTVVELVKNLGVSSGTDGETNQFTSNGLEGTSNINLRGLGPGRNLVLLNGRRNVFHTVPVAEQSQLFVNINSIPSIAIQRLELLKDGAAATYGSDAISGVANFITRSDFEGVEVTASHKEIQDSDGDQELGLIWGHSFGATHIVASFSHITRNQLKVTDRKWAYRPFSQNPSPGGWSGIPNPGAIFTLDMFPVAGITDVVPGGTYGFASTITVDPNCQAMTGLTASERGFCRYHYASFDNLIEEEERNNLFIEFSRDLGDGFELSGEIQYADGNVPNWATSPTYPPQVLFDFSETTGRWIYADNPGLIDMARQFNGTAAGDIYNTLADADCDRATDDHGCRRAIFFGRPAGTGGIFGGKAEDRGYRDYDTSRVVLALEGEATEGIDFNASVLWSHTQSVSVSYDTYVERWSAAFEGYGICGRKAKDAGTEPGTGNCQFYNPFSNAIEKAVNPLATAEMQQENPTYNADVANSDELMAWLKYGLGTDITSKLFVAETVFTGEWSENIAWAAGAQFREEFYNSRPFDGNNLNINPCITDAENERFRATGVAYDAEAAQCDNGTLDNTNDDYSGAGQFAFLAGNTGIDGDQRIQAVFGELAIQVTDDLELQLSGRYEDYVDTVGSTLDPKVAFRYQASDNIVLRGSASSTFRGPTINQTGGRSTTLSFVNSTSAFKAVDTLGTPNLKPESAETLNLGLVFDFDDLVTDADNIFLSVDYWRFDFTDPIIKESFNDLVGAAFNADGTIKDQALVDERFTLSSSSSTPSSRDIERIKVRMINGPDIETDGIDLSFRYTKDIYAGTAEISYQHNHVRNFDVGKGQYNEPFEAVGDLNHDVDYLRSMPKNRSKLGIKYSLENQLFNLVANYTGTYRDRQLTAARHPDGTLRTSDEIEDHTTFDFHYNVSLGEMAGGADTALWLSVYNLTDEDPPFATLDLNYDPYTHNPFGRMVKIGVKHKF